MGRAETKWLLGERIAPSKEEVGLPSSEKQGLERLPEFRPVAAGATLMFHAPPPHGRRSVDIPETLPLFMKCHFSTSHGLDFEFPGLLAGLKELL